MLKEIREKFLLFFEKRDHCKIESYSLIPFDDPSLLFINSGMAPMKKFFLNENIPLYKNIVMAQRCLRVGGKHNDLRDIGYSKRHHTFFEMLGNFSFGGYFKKEAIFFAWEFLTKELNLDVSRLFVTIHPKDAESFNIWYSLIDKKKIIPLDGNIWSIGQFGPCGYCSEIFYDLKEGTGDFESGDRYLEIWNLVFMDSYKDEIGIHDLPKACIDTGMGLERIVAVLEGESDTYNIKFFKQFLYLFKVKEHNFHTKIILDHLRSVSWIIQEGICPSSNNEGYILRRLIRRMLRSFDALNINNFIDIIENILNIWSNDYIFSINLITKIIKEESKLFEKTLIDGLKQFNLLFDKKNHFLDSDIFMLHDRFGLTFDIVGDLLKERGGTGDFDGFDKLLLNQKKKFDFDYSETKFIDVYELESQVVGIEENYLIFNKTPFYAESGGQIGDSGVCVGNKFRVNIVNTKKNNNIFFHEFELIDGEIKIGDSVKLIIDKNRRDKVAVHHSCVHLVQNAIDNLYCQVKQMGSFVSDVKFRLDFSWESDLEISKERIEIYLMEVIKRKVKSEIKYMELNAAKAIGAKSFFKYDSVVRVVKVGDSIELCGGSHVQNTQELIEVKILKICSVKSGVKRIEGVAGIAYLDYLKNIEKITFSVCDYLKCDLDNLLNYVKKNNNFEKNLEDLKKVVTINNYNIGLILVKEIKSIEDLMFKYKLDVCCVIVEKDEKINVILKSFLDFIDAEIVIKKIAKYIEAKGAGGNKSFAQTGGKKIDDYLILFDVLLKEFDL